MSFYLYLTAIVLNGIADIFEGVAEDRIPPILSGISLFIVAAGLLGRERRQRRS